ncbi:ABC transporter permease [Clostridium sp. LQ25]|uniref:ABC transporter permease n=1 Tax=Clostridium TaxID=1485 RepID=UPI000F539FDD|nr:MULTISPECIES: ABC transporter permease [Clostridium]RQN10617.1 ABC transporter permease [Clostridium butyricum]UZT06035.1 ABC transporter permease [Clostridium sp. LQ25]
MSSGFFKSLLNIVKQREFIFRLSFNDFKAKYSGSILGIIWAFIQPLVSILVFWFVFEMGFKSVPIDDIPFILWFIPAYIPWIFFNDILMSASNCLYEYNYLVKKVKFDVVILPIIKIISALFVHMFFIVFIYFIYLLYGYKINIYYLQSFYYTFALIVFSIGLSWLLSALAVFFKDIGQLVSMFLQIGFWITPIFWNSENVPLWIEKIIKLNPMYYIVRGYRDSFIYRVPFWERINTSIYFWVITILLLILGALVFKKLRPHFADEL